MSAKFLRGGNGGANLISTIHLCGNFTRFAYFLRSIEGVFDNYFLDFWWSSEIIPSTEYPD